jgi:hypothetical protein
MTTQAAGVFITDGIDATIERSAITGNEVMARDLDGEPAAYDAGLLVLDSTPVVRDTVISGNRVRSLTETTANVGPAGGAAEFHLGGTLRNVRVAGNTSDIRTTTGDATVVGAVIVFDFSGDPVPLRVRDSVIAGNASTAVGGAATAQGAGIYNNSLLDLRDVRVAFNSGRAAGGTAEGGGIWNGVAVSGPPVELTATDSAITHNALFGAERRGGGLFTTEPVTLTRTRIAANAPDQCFGC